MSALDALVQRAVGGDADAWRALQEALTTTLDQFVEHHEALRSRGLHSSVDERSEVRTATLERLHRNGFRNLQRYLEQRDRLGENAQKLESWLYGAVDYAVREHLRQRYGRAPKRDSAIPETAFNPMGGRRGVNTLADRLDAGALDHLLARTLGITKKLTADAIFSHVDATFSPQEAQALHMHYLLDRTFDEIAAALDLPDARSAEKLIRKLNARLRYEFDDTKSD